MEYVAVGKLLKTGRLLIVGKPIRPNAASDIRQLSQAGLS